MKARILNEMETKTFFESTGLKANSIIVYQIKRYYYAAVLDYSFRVRIDKELATKFI